MAEMANNFNLIVDENDIEQLLEVIPVELTNMDLLDLERELIAEEEARDKETAALTGVTQWNERWPVNPRVVSLIPCQGTCLGFWPGPQLGARKREPMDASLTHRCFSPSLSASLSLSLKINFKNIF